ncbi:hypothetical protein E1301_Tti019101 [Triplophysa tibetana]|uniref:Immunoglobulin domain-containing protein n=1 Tax=Triplophysa tibetana TaxID=1572043 RepID=A0A5A9NSA6_9TELE|nr:hypothetical protein E1301_Tti019101 [Triplophysa tibetana]
MCIIMDSMGIIMDSMGIIGVLSLFLIVNGVFGVADEVKSVMEGHSVTLHTDVIKQRDDLIVWYHGPDDAVVATIKGKVGTTTLSDDERYKDRLELNNQTGSLTINNLTTGHSGVYKLKISSNNKPSYKRFNVTVSVFSIIPPDTEMYKQCEESKINPSGKFEDEKACLKGQQDTYTEETTG